MEKLQIIDQLYEAVDAEIEFLWRGDIFFFEDPPDEDCRTYMLFIERSMRRLALVNILGLKAGAIMAANFPHSAGAGHSINLRISWLKENWDICMPFGSFETTRFFRWKSSGRG